MITVFKFTDFTVRIYVVVTMATNCENVIEMCIMSDYARFCVFFQ